jgi:citrate/tricarballylate utilization protein
MLTRYEPFASTCAATFCTYALGRMAPYPYGSRPVVLGTLGGVGLVIGTAGLLYLKGRQSEATRGVRQMSMDLLFMGQLLLTGASGLLLLIFQETTLLGILLVLHLGFVMTPFITMPYGKFVHALYRLGVLLKYARERPGPGNPRKAAKRDAVA